MFLIKGLSSKNKKKDVLNVKDELRLNNLSEIPKRPPSHIMTTDGYEIITYYKDDNKTVDYVVKRKK